VVAHKDVVLGLLGASAGLSGLLLVFLGFVVGAYGGLAGDTPKSIKKPLRTTGWVLLIAFAIGLVCVAVATIWLIRLNGGNGLYVATVTLFLAQVAALAVATVWTLRELLWD
jgi:uncharacterized membrane protein